MRVALLGRALRFLVVAPIAIEALSILLPGLPIDARPFVEASLLGPMLGLGVVALGSCSRIGLVVYGASAAAVMYLLLCPHLSVLAYESGWWPLSFAGGLFVLVWRTRVRGASWRQRPRLAMRGSRV